MENNLECIVHRIHQLIDEVYRIGFKSPYNDLEIIHCVSDDIITEMDDVYDSEYIKKALINMFIAGQLIPNSLFEKLQ